MRVIFALALAVLVVPACSTVGFGQFDPFNQFDGGSEFGQAGQAAVDPRMTAAEQAYHRGEFARVISMTTEIIDGNPQDASALHLRASAKVELGRSKKSAVQIREGIADARLALGVAGKTQSWLYVPYLYGMSGLAEIENRPEHAKVAIQVANPILERPDLTDVVKSQLVFQRALANLAAGNTAAGVTDLTTTLQLNPQHSAAYVKRSQTQAAQGDIKGALAGLNVATQNITNSPMLFNERGMLHRINKDLPKAIADFGSALRINPKFTVAYINRGVCELDQQGVANAERDFTEALKLNADNWMVFQFRGTARAMQGKLPDAQSDFSASLKLNPTNALALQERGFVRFSRQEFDAAAKDFAAALAVNPKAIHLIPWRAVSLARASQAELGQAALDELLKLPADESGWIGTLASYLTESIDEDALLKAAVDTEGAAHAPRECEAHFFIGQKKLQASDEAGAREQFTLAVAKKLDSLAAFRSARAALAAKQ